MADPLEQLLAAYDDTAPVERAWTIPAAWYVDPRIAELERRTVWSRTWQLVGRAAQVAAPGEFVTAEVAGEPVVVVRGGDGVLRGFFNVCRHHAAAVMTAPCGKVDRLRCPYHGWTYDLAGQLRGVPEFDGVRDFDRAATGLVPLAVAIWEGLVFVHLDPDPPALPDFLGELVAQVAPLGLGELVFCERREYTLACNWKVFVDNYLDGGYHVPHLHPSLSSILTYTDYTIENFERFCLQSSPIEGGGDPATAAVRQGRARYYWIYPNLMLNWYAGHLDTNLVIPLGVDRTRVVFEFFFAPGAGDPAAESDAHHRSIAVSERIQHEDVAICESVQRGLGSRAYRAGRLSVRREAGEHLFHRLLARDLRGGL